MKSLSKNTFFNIIYNITNMVFPLISSMYVARILFSDGVGKVSFAQNIVSYFISFAVLGIPVYGIREIAKVQKESAKRDTIFTELFLINIFSTAISVIVYIILIFNCFQLELPLFLCSGLSIFFNFINIDWLYQGMEEYSYIAIRSLLIKILLLIALILFVNTRSDYVIYSMILSLATGGNYIFNVINARKFVKLKFQGISIKKHLSSIIILALSILLSNLYSKVDITMIGTMVGDVATGYYTYAHRIIEIVLTACASFSSVFLPRLSLYYNKQPEDFNKLLKLGIRILTFITIPAAIGLFFLAPQLIYILYGEDFSSATFTVRMLSPLIIIKGFGNLLCYQLVICTGNEKKRIPAYGLAALLNLLLNYFLIPIFMERGAAFASVVSEFIVNGYQIYLMRKIIKIPFEKKALSQAIITTLIMSISLILISYLPFNYLVKTIVSVAMGFIVYILTNFLLRNQFLIEVIKKIKKMCYGIRRSI